jgi:hypothetical protein
LTSSTDHAAAARRLYDLINAGDIDGFATRCCVMEIDPIYVEVALRRWERFSGQVAERIDG